MSEILTRKTPSARMQRIVQEHPALGYFALVIGWSFPYMWIVLTLWPLDPVRGPDPLQILLIAVGTSPSLFGILMTYLTGGKDGLRQLLSRLTRWRVSSVWYAPALLLVPALNLITYLIYSRAVVKTYALPSAPISFAIAAGMTTAIFEEMGWRGFALPALQKRHSALTSSLILGLVWGTWHLPLFYLQRAHYGASTVPLVVLESLVSLTILSVLMTWIYNSANHSLLLMVLFHFSITGGNFLLQPPASSTGAEFLRFHMIAVIVQLSTAAVVVARAGANNLRLPKS